MSILIKGVSMPTSHRHPITVTIYSDWSVFNHDRADTVVHKAIPVPPHGRLIDADALYTVMKKERDRIAKDFGDDDPFARCLTKYAMSMVCSAPTIVPAEEDTDFFTKGHLHLGYAEEGEE